MKTNRYIVKCEDAEDKLGKIFEKVASADNSYSITLDVCDEFDTYTTFKLTDSKVILVDKVRDESNKVVYSFIEISLSDNPSYPMFIDVIKSIQDLDHMYAIGFVNTKLDIEGIVIDPDEVKIVDVIEL